MLSSLTPEQVKEGIAIEIDSTGHIEYVKCTTCKRRRYVEITYTGKGDSPDFYNALYTAFMRRP